MKIFIKTVSLIMLTSVAAFTLSSCSCSCTPRGCNTSKKIKTTEATVTETESIDNFSVPEESEETTGKVTEKAVKFASELSEKGFFSFFQLQNIAGSPYGLNDCRLVGIFLQLLPEPSDMYSKGGRLHIRKRSPNVRYDLVFWKRLAGIIKEVRKKVEFS